MAERLRNFARYLEGEGHSDLTEQVNVIANEVEARGIEYPFFPEQEQRNERHNLLLLTSALVQYQTEHPGERRLTTELAEGIRGKFGGILREDVPLTHLILPSEVYPFIPQDEITQTNLEMIDPALLKNYNNAIISVIRNYPLNRPEATLNQLRDMSIDELQELHNVGSGKATFVHTAFAKIPDEELI